MAIRTFNSVNGFSVGTDPTTVILGNGDVTTGNATFTANVTAGNVLTNNLLYANGSPWDFQEAAGNGNYQIQYNLNNNFGASSNFTFDPTTNLLTVAGNANIGNISVTGNVSAANFVGNVSGNISGNILLTGSNTGVLYNNNGTLAVSNAFSFNNSTNVVSVTNNLTAGNVYANAGTVGANLLTGTLTTNAQPNVTSLGTLSALAIAGTGSVAGANLVSANFITGTLTTPLQPNITEVGTLGNLSVQGNITAGNIYANAGVISALTLQGTLASGNQPNITGIGNLTTLTVTGNLNATGNVNSGNLSVANRVLTSLIPAINDTYNIGNSTLAWKEVYTANVILGNAYIKSTGNVITTDAANVANNLSTGTLTVRNDALLQGNATIAGNLTVSGNTTYINVTNLDISDPIISMGGAGNGLPSPTYDGKDRGMVLFNNYPNNLAYNQAFIWKTANSEFQAISNVTSFINEDVVAASFGNIRASTFIGNLSGTVTTAAQPNITSLGTLSNLTISGNLQVNSTANINSLRASGITYPGSDGSSGQVLATYGNGQLYFTTVSTAGLANGTSNIQVLNSGNITFSSAGNANVVVVTGAGVNVAGTGNVTGALNVGGNTTVANLIVGNTTVRASTVTTASIANDQVIAAVPKSGIRGVFFDVKGEDTTGGKYSIASVGAVHNSLNVDYTIYGSVQLGGSTGVLGVSIDATDIYLTVTPSSTNSTVWTVQIRTI